MRHLTLSIIAVAFSLAPITNAATTGTSNDVSVAAAKLAKETKVIYVGRLTGIADSFIDDQSPNTLQIVTLPKHEGINHTSENGEVIFIKEKISAADREKLISQAFLLKAKLKQAASPKTK